MIKPFIYGGTKENEDNTGSLTTPLYLNQIPVFVNIPKGNKNSY
jgi:hypothetical protein